MTEHGCPVGNNPPQPRKTKMTSMRGYRRFRDALDALRECHAHLRDPLITGSVVGEATAREQLVELCGKILEDVGLTITGHAVITENDEGSDE
jgi:hypothetical protein